MTLQAQQVHLAHPQIARVGRTVRGVATATALRLDRYVLVDERPLLVGMAFDTYRVPTRHDPQLPESGSSMNVVAVAALDKTFVYSMVIRLGEVGFGGGMTPVTEIGLRPCKQVRGILGMMRRVAVQAANIVARVRGCGEVSLLMLFTVATQALRARILLRHRREANDLGHVPTALDVRGSGTVTGFAAMSIAQGGLEVWGVFEVLLVQVLVAGLAGVNTNVLPCPLLGRRGVFFLLAGSKDWLNQQRQQDCRRNQLPKLIPHSSRLHSRTPRFAKCAELFHLATLDPATAHASRSGSQSNLLETLDVLSNRLGLLVIQPSDALVVRGLTP